MIDPVALLVKTTANYVAFKAVKSTVDYVWNRQYTTDQFYKVVECNLCFQLWINNPETCPHCGVATLSKLFRDYEFKNEEDGFNIDNNLTIRG